MQLQHQPFEMSAICSYKYFFDFSQRVVLIESYIISIDFIRNQYYGTSRMYYLVSNQTLTPRVRHSIMRISERIIDRVSRTQQIVND